MVDPTVYQVKRGSDVGSLSLDEEQICFKPTGKNAKELTDTLISWKSVTKHQANPPKNAKAMVKITSKDGSNVTFQLKNRDILNKLLTDISQRLEKEEGSTHQEHTPKSN